MADGIFPSLVSKSRDINSATNPIFVELSDGAQILAFAYLDDSNNWEVEVDNVVVSGFLFNDDTVDTVDEGDVGAARMTEDRKQLIVIADPTNDGQRLAIDSNGKIGVSSMPTVTVTASDLDIRNLNLTDDAVKISANSTANSVSNPIYVAITTSAVSTTEIHDYDTSVNVAVDTADNHDYPVPSGTFLLKSVIVSASGNIKFEVQVGPVASLVTKAVGFLTGRQGDTKQIFFDPAIEVPTASTGTVRIARTNRQGATMDVYSTIIGNLI